MKKKSIEELKQDCLADAASAVYAAAVYAAADAAAAVYAAADAAAAWKLYQDTLKEEEEK